MEARPPTKAALQIAHDGDAPVVFSPADFDRFVLTQRDTLQAAQDHLARERLRHSIGERFGSWLYELHRWCEDHGVLECYAAPRLDDLMVVLVAATEDTDGALHDAMSQFDLDSFNRNSLRISWLLLRASEAAGRSAFLEPSLTRVIYRAQPKAA